MNDTGYGGSPRRKRLLLDSHQMSRIRCHSFSSHSRLVCGCESENVRRVEKSQEKAGRERRFL